MTTHLAADLLPCPFCGGEAEIWKAKRDWPAWIGCMGRCAVLVSKEYKTDKEAIAAWNTRAAAVAADPALLGLEAAPQIKPPFEFDRYINGVLMAEGVTVERATTIEDAARVAASIASRGPNGEPAVLVYCPPSPSLEPAPDHSAALAEALREAKNGLEWAHVYLGRGEITSVSVDCALAHADAALAAYDAAAKIVPIKVEAI